MTKERTARTGRQQLIVVLADNSGSMRQGGKAEAAMQGIKDLVCELSARGPSGKKGTYYCLLLVRFDEVAEVEFGPDLVEDCDPDEIVFPTPKYGTNIGAALSAAYEVLAQWMATVQKHPERDLCPLPRVILFSDGHNGPQYADPVSESAKIKNLDLDGEPVVIVTAGVSVGDRDKPDVDLLKKIASTPSCYFHITQAEQLSQFLAVIGSVTGSSVEQMEREMSRFAGQSDPLRLEY